MLEAAPLVEHAGLDLSKLNEPLDEPSILLHNEASDTCRRNELAFHVIKVKIEPNLLPREDIKEQLELEEFKLA